MSSAQFDPTFDWRDIEEHTLTLRGVGHPQPDGVAASVVFVARSVLSSASKVHAPSAIAFDTTLSIPHTYSANPVQVFRCCGNYGSLAEQRAELVAVRGGAREEATLSLEGLELHFFHNERSPGTSLCVEGISSSVLDQKHWPWPKSNEKVGRWLADRNYTAYCLRFAFLVPLVDPPYFDSFINDFDLLLSHLQQLGDS